MPLPSFLDRIATFRAPGKPILRVTETFVDSRGKQVVARVYSDGTVGFTGRGRLTAEQLRVVAGAASNWPARLYLPKPPGVCEVDCRRGDKEGSHG